MGLLYPVSMLLQRSEVGRTNSQLREWDCPRSTWMHNISQHLDWLSSFHLDVLIVLSQDWYAGCWWSCRVLSLWFFGLKLSVVLISCGDIPTQIADFLLFVSSNFLRFLSLSQTWALNSSCMQVFPDVLRFCRWAVVDGSVDFCRCVRPWQKLHLRRQLWVKFSRSEPLVFRTSTLCLLSLFLPLIPNLARPSSSC